MCLLVHAQVIKRFIMHAKKTAFIVEHDFIMAAYLADRVIVYEGTPSKEAFARQPQSLLTGDCSAPLPLQSPGWVLMRHSGGIC